MKTILVPTILAAAFVASRALAADVAYELDMPKLEAMRASDDSEAAAVEVVERAWAAPGVEESDDRLPPAHKFDFTASSHVKRLQFSGDGPSWLDDVIWPRTRAMYHPNGEPVTSICLAADSDNQVYYFGRIGLQR
ncbi:MAG: hypothetical protein U0805_23425 [Pirellulales bacterium]